MKPITNRNLFVLAILLFASFAARAQNTSATTAKAASDTGMKTYLIEREIPGAGKLTADQLKAISQASCTVLKEMGPRIEWVHSYVTGEKIVCIYRSESEELIRQHAKKGGFPANAIRQISSVISPATAD